MGGSNDALWRKYWGETEVYGFLRGLMGKIKKKSHKKLKKITQKTLKNENSYLQK